MRSTRSPCGSIRAKPLPRSRSCRAMLSMRVDLPVPVFPWLQIECSRCKTPRDVDLCALRRPPTTFVHDLVGAVGLSEVQERRQTPSGHAAPACTAPAASGGGRYVVAPVIARDPCCFCCVVDF